MSKCKDDFNCVCDAVQNINDLQDAVEDKCPTSCFSNLLSPTNFLGDTIPFILYTKKGDLFKAFGNVGELRGGTCFQTPFFRVENIKHGCCATLSLLRPDVDLACKEAICEVQNLVKTDFCIEVDLNCFCAIQCLDPRLVVPFFPDNNEVPEPAEVEDHGGRRRRHR